MDVRWQWYFAPLLEKLKRRTGKSDAPEIVLTTEDADDASRGRHFETFAYRFTRAELHNSLVRSDCTLQEYFDAASGGLASYEPRCNDFRVVENEEIAGTQEPWEIAHGAVA
jgi:hypothetical protein